MTLYTRESGMGTSCRDPFTAFEMPQQHDTIALHIRRLHSTARSTSSVSPTADLAAMPTLRVALL